MNATPVAEVSALIAEHHAPNVHGGAQIVGNLVLLAVEHRAGLFQLPNHGLDGQLQLNVGVLREATAPSTTSSGCSSAETFWEKICLNSATSSCRSSAETRCRSSRRERASCGNGVFEQVAVEAHNHVREHLDEATIAVPRKRALSCA